jgi:hypothetical protein
MKFWFALMVWLGTASGAFADGFVCKTIEEDLNLTIYDNIYSELGTRVAAVMVISDPTVETRGRRTIAVFRQAKGTLSNFGIYYVAKVDLRYAELSRGGELLLGTRLGELGIIQVGIDFSYSHPVKKGESLHGFIDAHKRDGEEIWRNLECVRYLKQAYR